MEFVDKIIAFLSGFNFQTIISMIAVCWFFARDVKSEMKSEIGKLEQDIRQQGQRTDRLYEMFYDLIKETRGK